MHRVQAELLPENVMTDEMRAKATELLRLQRAALQKALPARVDDGHHDPRERDRHGLTGRFIPNPDNGDHKN